METTNHSVYWMHPLYDEVLYKVDSFWLNKEEELHNSSVIFCDKPFVL